MPAVEEGTVAFAAGPELRTRLRRELPPSDASTVEHWLAGQPSAETLVEMSPDQRQRLIERRLWSLVYYVGSLNRPRNVLHRLLLDDPEPEAGVPWP
jgi:hypothetical protein